MAEIDNLTPRQRAFLEVFLKTWNATEAARQAGYKKPNIQGPRLLLSNVSIQEAKEKRLKEMAMDANEVLARLGEQASVSIADFLSGKVEETTDKNGKTEKIMTVGIDWEMVSKRGHLIKSIKPTAAGIALELHDAQAALIKLGEHHKLFTKNVDITSAGEKLQTGDDEKFSRALSTLADAIGKALSSAPAEPESAVDAAERPPVAGSPVEGG